MIRVIPKIKATEQLRKILDLIHQGDVGEHVSQKEVRFLIGRYGKPEVMVMSIGDFIKTIEAASDGLGRRGIDSCSIQKIDQLMDWGSER